MHRNVAVIVFSLLTGFIPAALADEGSFSNNGGTASATSSFIVNSPVAAPAGALNINCPGTSSGACSGGSFSFQSTDGSASISASFSSGTFAETCWGGGVGGHITCEYTFTGQIHGTMTRNGLQQAINGVTHQSFIVGGTGPSGTSAYNSAYTPFYYSDSQQILRSDDLQGTNQVSYGSQGSGVGHFNGAEGIALDSAGRIYVADTYNCRVVRIDDMKGTNWISYGTCGSGVGQFSDPGGIAITPAGEIYILDSGNNRIVQMDNMTGSNWEAYGSSGSGVGQFSRYVQSIAVDAHGRIYVADTSNLRIVRMDDMNGTNWTVLTHSAPINGVTYSFQSPAAVALDAKGRVYIADNESYQPALIRVDDMNGTNWTSLYVGAGAINSLSIDAAGLVFAGGGGVRLIENQVGVLNSSGKIAPIGGYYVFGISHMPVSSPPPPAAAVFPGSLHFSNENVGATSSSQTIRIHNFGGAPLEFASIAAKGGFIDTTDCGSGIVAGSSCNALVSFAPKVPGIANGTLTLTDNSGNLGPAQVVALTGFATQPVADVVPANLTFPPQILNTVSAAQSIMVLNTGNGPLQVASIVTAKPFSESSNCSAPIPPGMACTIKVTFGATATGAVAGSLTINGNTASQTVALSGTGSAVAQAASVSPASLLFPPQLVGTGSAAQTLTITNNTNATIANAGLAITGDFAETANCGASIAAGAHCTATVTFKPSTAGTRTGSVTVNLGSGLLRAALSGTGSTGNLPAALKLNPSSITFTGYVVGDSATQTLSVANMSDASTGILSITVAGDPSLTQTNNCPASLSAGASCSIGVTFTPVNSGTFTGTLTVTEGSGTKDHAPLSGTATASGN